MDRPKVVKVLRISFSAVCLIGCVLLIGLWVRSYEYVDTIVWSHAPGKCTVVDSFPGRVYVGFYTGQTKFRITSKRVPGLAFFDSGTSAVVVRHLSLAGTFLILAALPWLPWSNRFSLRTLLIVATIFAVGSACLLWR